MNTTFDSPAPMLAYTQKIETKHTAYYLRSLEARLSTYDHRGPSTLGASNRSCVIAPHLAKAACETGEQESKPLLAKLEFKAQICECCTEEGLISQANKHGASQCFLTPHQRLALCCSLGIGPKASFRSLSCWGLSCMCASCGLAGISILQFILLQDVCRVVKMVTRTLLVE
jgi:hypothetical protein